MFSLMLCYLFSYMPIVPCLVYNSRKFVIFTTSVCPNRSICLWWIFTRGAFRAQNAIKKVHYAAKTGSVFFPPSRATFTCGTRRERAVTRFASYWPLAVASAARDAFTHTHTHTYTGPSHRTLHQQAREVSPPTRRTHFRNWMFESGRPTFNYAKLILENLFERRKKYREL